VKQLLEASDKEKLLLFVQRWHSGNLSAPKKAIIKLALRSSEVFKESSQVASSFLELIHVNHTTIQNLSLLARKESEHLQEWAYRAVLASLDLPFDPDISRLHVDERYELAKSKETPKHILEELLQDSYVGTRDAARQNLASKMAKVSAMSSHALDTEGGRSAWALEQLLHCELPVSGAMSEVDRKKYLYSVYDAMLDAMDMPFDPDLATLTVGARLKLACAADTPIYVFEKLTQDANGDVKLALVENRQVPLVILSRMRGDSDQRVAAAVDKKANVAAVQLRDIEFKEGVAERKRLVATKKELQKMIAAPDKESLLAITRSWRHEIPADLQKSIFISLLNMVGSEKQVPKSHLNQLAPIPAKPVSQDPSSKGNPLRFDQRLWARAHVDRKPTVAHIIEKVREATKLDITIAPELKGHEPDLGVVLPEEKGWYAFQLMSFPLKQLENGRWEKTATGYRLEGKSLLSPPPTSTPPVAVTSAAAKNSPSNVSPPAQQSQGSGWYVLFGGAGGFILGCAFLLGLRKLWPTTRAQTRSQVSSPRK